MTEDTATTVEGMADAGGPAVADAGGAAAAETPAANRPSPSEVWAKDPQVALVQGPNLDQIVWRGQTLQKAEAYYRRYGDGKGWHFRAAFLNPAKKSHIVLGPEFPLTDEGKPTAEGVDLDSTDLSAFATVVASPALVAVRPQREPRAPRAPREQKPREPRLTGVAPLSSISENADLYPFLRMGENQQLFVHNPNRTRSIRWDFAPTAEFLENFKAATQVEVPIEKLVELSDAAETKMVTVRTRWSRYDITLNRAADGSVVGVAVEKYRREDHPPPPVVSEESKANRRLNARAAGDRVVAEANAAVAAANAATPATDHVQEVIDARASQEEAGTASEVESS